MDEDIAVVVVTYNRKLLLLETLTAILNQTVAPKKIYLIDNASNDGTQEALRQAGHLGDARINYVRLETNTGGSGGFHAGIANAVSGGHQWILVMDDDAMLQPDAIERLMHVPELGHDVIARACLVRDEQGLIQTEHRGFFDPERFQIPLSEAQYQQPVVNVSYASFVGLAIRRDAIEAVGLPNKEFFIWGDDFEYCLRLTRMGRIVLVRDSVIIHRDGRMRAQVDSLTAASNTLLYWKQLCALRNREYILRHYGRWTWFGFIYRAFRRVVRIVLFETDKWLKLRWTIAYLRQAISGVFKTVTPGEWRDIVNR